MALVAQDMKKKEEAEQRERTEREAARRRNVQNVEFLKDAKWSPTALAFGAVCARMDFRWPEGSLRGILRRCCSRGFFEGWLQEIVRGCSCYRSWNPFQVSGQAGLAHLTRRPGTDAPYTAHLVKTTVDIQTCPRRT